MSKVKSKERILKAAREKQLVTYKGAPIRISADFSKETLQAGRDWQEIFKVMKGKDLYIQEYSTQQSYHLDGKVDKALPRQGKAKGVHHHQSLIILNIKGTYLRKKKIKTMNIKRATNSQL